MLKQIPNQIIRRIIIQKSPLYKQTKTLSALFLTFTFLRNINIITFPMFAKKGRSVVENMYRDLFYNVLNDLNHHILLYQDS